MHQYRPYITLPNGEHSFANVNVRTEEDVQRVLKAVSDYTQSILMMKPGVAVFNIRELSSKVEFFKVAFG